MVKWWRRVLNWTIVWSKQNLYIHIVYTGDSSLIWCIYTGNLSAHTVCVWYFPNSCKLNIWNNVIILVLLLSYILRKIYYIYYISHSCSLFRFYFNCLVRDDMTFLFYLTFILINYLANNDTVTNKKKKKERKF